MAACKQRCEVLVVGAGPVGLMAALLLHERGIDVEIIDEAWRSTGRSYAAAVHPRSLALLAHVGIADSVVAQAHRIDTVAFYDVRELKARVQLSEIQAKYPFVAVLPQSSLEALLERALRDRKVPIHWHHRASGFEATKDRVIVEVDEFDRASTGYAYARSTLEIKRTLKVESRYVVGADGHRSLVRRAFGLEYPLIGAAEHYDVFEFASSADLGSEVRVVLDDAMANVLWSLPGGRQRWSFQVADPGAEHRERLKSRLSMQVPGESSAKLTAEYLKSQINRRAPWFDAEVGDIAWTGEVHFEHRLAQSFGEESAWLAGDSGHQTGPIGVQSMNVGLCEAAELASRLEEVLRKKASAAVLKDYNQERLSEWRRLLGLQRGYQAGEVAGDWVRHYCQRLVECLPASGPHLDQLVAQLGFGP